MKYLFQIFLLSLLSISSLYSQRSVQIENLEEAFKYIEGQQFTLEYIEHNFPTLKIKAEKASLNFNKNFNIAINSISTEIQQIHKENYQKVVDNQKTELAKIFNQKKMSYDQALTIIENTKYRTKGNINPKIAATLFTYQYYQNPEKEFLEGHIKEYEVRSSTHGLKLFLKIKIPLSWKLIDESNTSLLYQFRSENGNGPLEMLVNYRKLSEAEKISNNLNQPSLRDLDLAKKQLSEPNQTKLKPQETRLQYKPVTHSKSNKNIDNFYYSTDNFLISIKTIITAKSSSQKDMITQKYNGLIRLINKSIQLEKEKLLSTKF